MIEFDDVRKMFDGRVVLDGVSFDVAAGELVVLLGPSGCGRTTTLKLVNRLLWLATKHGVRQLGRLGFENATSFFSDRSGSDSALPPYEAVLLITPELASHAGIEAALEPLIGAISVEEMRHANGMVDRLETKVSVEEAVLWLETHGVERTTITSQLAEVD